MRSDYQTILDDLLDGPVNPFDELDPQNFVSMNVVLCAFSESQLSVFRSLSILAPLHLSSPYLLYPHS